MNSRMDRYESENFVSQSLRSEKNQKLYNEINNQTLSRVKADKNYQVIEEHPKEIDIEKIKRYINSLNEEPIERKKIIINKENEDLAELEEEPKIYDINSIIEEAKSKRETSYEEDKYRKLHGNEYDILKKLDNYNKELEKEEEKFNTNERTLIDLINTVTTKKEEEKDLLSELTASKNENTTIMKPIKEENNEKLNVKEVEPKEEKLTNTLSSIDKSFYTNSMNFSKEDFEGIEELEKSVSKNNVLVRISIAILLILVVGTIIIILNYVLSLGLF